MPDHDPIRARHYEIGTGRNGRFCATDLEPWPCDTATVLAALDDCNEVRGIYVQSLDAMATERNEAEARETRLRAAISDFIIWWDMPPFLTDDARLSEEVAALRADEVRPQKAGACCDEPTLVCTTCGDAHVHGDPRPDHERLAGAWHVWLAEKERIEAEAVAAERQRIKAGVERLSLLDAPGMWVEFDAVIAIIDGESDDA